MKDIAEQVARELTDSLKYVQWDNERIECELGLRSTHTILEDGTTHYAGACLDATLVAMQKWNEHGYMPRFFFEVVYDRRYGIPRIHTAIEIHNGNSGKHIFDIFSGKSIAWYQGEYRNQFENHVGRIRLKPLEGIMIDESMTFEDMVREKYGTLFWLMPATRKDMVHGLVNANTEENFKRHAYVHEPFKIVER